MTWGMKGLKLCFKHSAGNPVESEGPLSLSTSFSKILPSTPIKLKLASVGHASVDRGTDFNLFKVKIDIMLSAPTDGLSVPVVLVFVSEVWKLAAGNIHFRKGLVCKQADPVLAPEPSDSCDSCDILQKDNSNFFKQLLALVHLCTTHEQFDESSLVGLVGPAFAELSRANAVTRRALHPDNHETRLIGVHVLHASGKTSEVPIPLDVDWGWAGKVNKHM